jgi:probable rRNA maturation factor
MTVQVDVQNACDDDTVPEVPIVESWIESTVVAAGIVVDTEVSVRVVSPEEVHALNSEYRGKEKPTNVLSFPAGKVAGLPDDMPQPLGDIVICAQVVRDEAREQGKAVADHWAHMLVHGTLHLLGFDHETDSDAAEMEALETRILSDQGLADPYGASGET